MYNVRLLSIRHDDNVYWLLPTGTTARCYLNREYDAARATEQVTAQVTALFRSAQSDTDTCKLSVQCS